MSKSNKNSLLKLFSCAVTSSKKKTHARATPTHNYVAPAKTKKSTCYIDARPNKYRLVTQDKIDKLWEKSKRPTKETIQKRRAQKQKKKKRILKLCPMCRRMFTPDMLQKHAGSCRGSSKRKFIATISTGTGQIAHRRKRFMRQPTLLLKNSLRKNKTTGSIDTVQTGWVRKGNTGRTADVSSSEEELIL